jgi:SAM-dependent methyltransferase
MLRAVIRGVFSRLRALPLMDSLHFHLSTLRYQAKNRRFLAARPDFALPPDRFLQETYRLDYSAYEQDGQETVHELFARCRPFLSDASIDVLEWGCGVARLTRHLPSLPGVKSVTGVDVNGDMIRWNQRHISGVRFLAIGHESPTALESQAFDLVMAVSVLTHIPGGEHLAWFEEIWRLLRPGGLFLFTTHGRAFLSKLGSGERSRLQDEGFVTRDYPRKGHRMMSTFQEPRHVRGLLQGRFQVLESVDGAEDRGAAGRHDLWLVRKVG